MSRQLLLLTGVASVAVVVHHATAWVVTASIWWADRFSPVAVPHLAWVGSPAFYLIRVIDQFAFFPVPAFLFVSGYFLAVVAGKTGTGLTWDAILRRCLALVLPYLFWSLILVGMNIRSGATYDMWGLARVFLLGQAAGPYYYVPMIVQLYLLSQWIVPLASAHGKALLGVLAMVALSTFPARYLLILQVEPFQGHPLAHLLANWQLPAYAIWFGCGAVCAFHLPRFRRELLRWRGVLVLGTVVTLALGLLESELLRMAAGREWLSPQATLLNSVASGFLIMSFLALAGSWVPGAASLSRLGGMAFGIYLMHVPVEEVVARVAYHLTPGLLAFPLAVLVLLTASGLGLPVLAMTVVRHSGLKRAYGYVFG